MKRMLGWASAAMFALSGCAVTSVPSSEAQSASAAPAQSDAAARSQSERILVNDDRGQVVVEMVAFRTGRSSATVERMARESGCTGSRSAGLLTEEGPVEVYRMQCDDGTVYLARCELRQCSPMRSGR